MCVRGAQMFLLATKLLLPINFFRFVVLPWSVVASFLENSNSLFVLIFCALIDAFENDSVPDFPCTNAVYTN